MATATNFTTDIFESKPVLLNSKQLDSFGFDTKQIEKMLTTHIDGKQDLKWPLFTLYTLTK